MARDEINDKRQAAFCVTQMTQAHAEAGQLPSKANLCRHLKRAAQEHPDELAVAVQKASGRSVSHLSYAEMTFAALDKHSDAIAFALTAHGIIRGMKAVLMVTPSLNFFALTFALFKAGIIPIFVDPGMGIKSLKQCFAEAQPDAFIGIAKAHLARRLFTWDPPSVQKWVYVDSNVIEWAHQDKPVSQHSWQSFASRLSGAVSLSRLLAQQVRPVAEYPIAWLTSDDMAAILFTSGSTGAPKGVVYSHSMFEAQINALKVDYGIGHGERDLATFPLFSLFGPALGMASIVPHMDASKPITANTAFIFAAIERYQCTNMFVNPALLKRLGEAGEGQALALTSLKRVISAGAPATIVDIESFSRILTPKVPILNSYGATESLPVSMIASDALLTTTAVTNNGGGICVGYPIAGVRLGVIAITDAAIATWDEACLLNHGQIGEIVVQGAVVSQRYYQRESATLAAKMWDDSAQCYWHRMGDLGYLDAEGKLWMCGRKAHRVDIEHNGTLVQRYYSIACERIFNTLPEIKRTALVAVEIAGNIEPLLCVEVAEPLSRRDRQRYYARWSEFAQQFPQTQGIAQFLIHPDFPVDVRHNAKIFREKLALWAQARCNL